MGEYILVDVATNWLGKLGEYMLEAAILFGPARQCSFIISLVALPLESGSGFQQLVDFKTRCNTVIKQARRLRPQTLVL